jgi:hypothetical protein
MSRFTRAAAVLTSLVAAILVPTQIALADVPYPPTGEQPVKTSSGSTPAVVHLTSSSGISSWAIFLIAVAAMLVGVAVAQFASKLRRRGHAHGPATA